MHTDFVTVVCPHCGERFETAIDSSVESAQDYVEDCAICCQPIVFQVSLGADGSAQVRVGRDD